MPHPQVVADSDFSAAVAPPQLPTSAAANVNNDIIVGVPEPKRGRVEPEDRSDTPEEDSGRKKNTICCECLQAKHTANVRFTNGSWTDQSQRNPQDPGMLMGASPPSTKPIAFIGRNTQMKFVQGIKPAYWSTQPARSNAS